AAWQICTLPDTNPVTEAAKSCWRQPAKRLISPLHSTLYTNSLKPERIETIQPALFRAATTHISRLMFKTAPTREESIQAERSDDAEVKITTDRLGYKEGIGGAAVLKRRGVWEMKTLKLHLGQDSQHTVFNGEEVEALLGLHLLGKETDLNGKNISIFIDSQALVQVMETRKTTLGQ
ncbi:hypothetical protein DL96DRAFT_1482292, partial [Flagelloscypha sp. PMI_526]